MFAVMNTAEKYFLVLVGLTVCNVFYLRDSLMLWICGLVVDLHFSILADHLHMMFFVK